MNCKQCSELLVDYIRNDLPATSAAALAGHLQGCSHCSIQLEKLQELTSLLDTPEAPSAALEKNFQTRLAAEIARSSPMPAQKVPPRSGLFQALWPSRPFAAVCYSFALLACGLVSGQLLPPATLGFAALQESSQNNQLQICAVPLRVNYEFL